MWTSRTKTDLIIEVWEKLDCESVGAVEIEAIETAIEARFGAGAVDSPMTIARLLADEGAELRHSEIMTLFVSRKKPLRDEALDETFYRFDSIPNAVRSMRAVEVERRKALSPERTRRLRERLMEARSRAIDASRNPRIDGPKRAELTEIGEWLTLFLQTPEIFANWLELRIDSKDFKERFQPADPEENA